MPFVEFWATITKFSVFMDFLDKFLLNFRKYNDLQKLMIPQIGCLINNESDE